MQAPWEGKCVSDAAVVATAVVAGVRRGPAAAVQAPLVGKSEVVVAAAVATAVASKQCRLPAGASAAGGKIAVRCSCLRSSRRSWRATRTGDGDANTAGGKIARRRTPTTHVKKTVLGQANIRFLKCQNCARAHAEKMRLFLNECTQ